MSSTTLLIDTLFKKPHWQEEQRCQKQSGSYVGTFLKDPGRPHIQERFIKRLSWVKPDRTSLQKSNKHNE